MPHISTGTAKTILHALGIAVQQAVMYGPAHNVARLAAKEAAAVLAEELGRETALEISVAPQGGGAIVNIASVVGLMGNACQANYSASKGGLIALTKTTARELGSRGVRANAVAPGFINSKMTEVLPDAVKQQMLAIIPLKKFGEVQDIAKTVAFLASDAASYITGQVISVNGGMLMP